MAFRFLQFGAFPVFVIDGTPSPLKSQARIARFFRASGIELSDLPVAEEGVSVDRNRAFSKCVQECVVGCLFYHGCRPTYKCVGILVLLFCASICIVLVIILHLLAEELGKQNELKMFNDFILCNVYILMS